MKKRTLSLLLALCITLGMIPLMAPQTEAFDLLAIFDAAAPVVRGAINAADQAKEENWDFGKAITGTFKSIGKELLDMGDDDASSSTVIVNEVDLSEVELELANIQSTLEGQSLTLTQIKSEMNSNMQSISSQLTSLSEQISDSTTQLQYHNYLTQYFSFYNEFYEAVSYYDQALTTLYSSNPTQMNIKNNFDQFYALQNVSYTGNLYSAIDRLGKYLRGEYLSTDPGSVVDILCEYYELAGYGKNETADAIKSFVAQTYYTYCLANYYYLSVALFQHTYLADNNLADYPSDFGIVLNKTQIEQLSKSVLDSFAETTAIIFKNLNDHFCSMEAITVSYCKGTSGSKTRTITDSVMDIEPNSGVTVAMPDSTVVLEQYLGSDFVSMFGGMCTYSYSSSSSMVAIDGNILDFSSLTEGASIDVTMICSVGGTEIPLHSFTFNGKKGALGGGYGTMDYPYVIETTDQWKSFVSGGYGSSFVSLNADLDFNGDSVDSVLYEFDGIFYGNGHTISNLQINYGGFDNCYGLFSSVSGRIYDLNVKNATVQPYNDGDGLYCVGVIAGRLNGGQIYRCEAVDSSSAYAADSKGSAYVGGLVGQIKEKGSMTGCIAYNCQPTVGFNSTVGCVGGLVGVLTGKSSVTYCGREEGWLWQYNNNNSSNSAGGLIGEVYSSTVSNCWNYKTDAASSDSYRNDATSNRHGSFVGYCEYMTSSSNFIYTGTGAKNTFVDFVKVGTVRAGSLFEYFNATDMTKSKVRLGNISYLENVSGTGNPIRLTTTFKLELDTSNVKTVFSYGEDFSYAGLIVNLKRGDLYATSNVTMYKVTTPKGFSTKTPGTYTITVSFNGAASASYEITVLPKAHTFKQVLEPSSCTEAGSVYYICQDNDCSETFDRQTLPARGHTLTHYDAIDADCNGASQREYWHCTVCGKYYLDEDCTNESSQANLSFAGTKHNYTTPEYTWAQAADGTYTCTASTYCQNSGCPEHSQSNPLTETAAITVDNITEATCKLTGKAVYTATFKDSRFATQVKEVELATIECPSKSFKDVKKGSWFHEATDFVVSRGLMNGTSANAFEPNLEMSRAMLVTVLWRMEGSPAPKSKAPFTDLKQSWYRDAVAWAYENDIVKGITETTFEPDGDVIREQLAAIFYRYAEYRGIDVSARADLSNFKDASKIRAYATENASWAYAVGLITGQPSGDFEPRGNATRAQVATILMRFIGSFN